jgi:hypothetical protein
MRERDRDARGAARATRDALHPHVVVARRGFDRPAFGPCVERFPSVADGVGERSVAYDAERHAADAVGRSARRLECSNSLCGRGFGRSLGREQPELARAPRDRRRDGSFERVTTERRHAARHEAELGCPRNHGRGERTLHGPTELDGALRRVDERAKPKRVAVGARVDGRESAPLETRLEKGGERGRRVGRSARDHGYADGRLGITLARDEHPRRARVGAKDRRSGDFLVDVRRARPRRRRTGRMPARHGDGGEQGDPRSTKQRRAG